MIIFGISAVSMPFSRVAAIMDSIDADRHKVRFINLDMRSDKKFTVKAFLKKQFTRSTAYYCLAIVQAT